MGFLLTNSWKHVTKDLNLHRRQSLFVVGDPPLQYSLPLKNRQKSHASKRHPCALGASGFPIGPPTPKLSRLLVPELSDLVPQRVLDHHAPRPTREIRPEKSSRFNVDGPWVMGLGSSPPKAHSPPFCAFVGRPSSEECRRWLIQMTCKSEVDMAGNWQSSFAQVATGRCRTGGQAKLTLGLEAICFTRHAPPVF